MGEMSIAMARQRRLADIQKKKKSVSGSCGMHLDTSLKIMEETRFKKKWIGLTKQLSKEVHFTYNEIESLLLIYYNTSKKNGPKSIGMTLSQFANILYAGLDMTDSTLTSLIAPMCHFKLIPGAPSYLSMESWIRALSLFLRGDLEEKMEHCYKVYDFWSAGHIGRELSVQLMSAAMFGEEDKDDAARDLLEIVQRKMDYDKDGQISKRDYMTGVRVRPVLMEYLGPCLPSPSAARTFLATFTHLTDNQYKQEVLSNESRHRISVGASIRSLQRLD